MGRLASVLLIALSGAACLVQRPAPDAPAPSAAHETRRSSHPDGTTRSQTRVLVWSDGRVERDGPEREYHPDGTLAAERFFDHDAPAGLWRTWFADGKPRSEVDFGSAGSSTLRVDRFWHANGRLAAEGTTVAGVREGRWSYWDEEGGLLRAGSYRTGKRDGLWTFFDARGAKRAEGLYALGARVGAWTLWNERGEASTRSSAVLEDEELDLRSESGAEPEVQ